MPVVLPIALMIPDKDLVNVSCMVMISTCWVGSCRWWIMSMNWGVMVPLQVIKGEHEYHFV